MTGGGLVDLCAAAGLNRLSDSLDRTVRSFVSKEAQSKTDPFHRKSCHSHLVMCMPKAGGSASLAKTIQEACLFD